MSVLPLVMGSLAALVLVTGTTYASYRLAAALVAGDSPILRLAAMTTIGSWLATVGFHLLFALSLFDVAAASVAVALLALVASRFPANRTTQSLLSEHGSSLRAAFGPGLSTAERLLLYVALPTAALLLLRGLLLPPLAWDWLTYHGVRSALFVQNAAWTLPEAPGTWGLYRHFFAGVEVLAAWSMLPFRSDLAVGVCTWLQWIAFGVSVAAYAEAAGLGVRAASISGIALLFVPSVLSLTLGGYAENVLGASVVAALAFAIGFARTARPGFALLAFAASGVAVGIKVTALPPCAVACLVVAGSVLCSARHRSTAAAVAVALGGLATLLPPLPWLWIAALDTGSPLSPLPVSWLGFELGVAPPEMERVEALGTSAAYTLEGELGVLRYVFDNHKRFTLGPLSLIPILLAPLAALRLLLRRRWLEVGATSAAMLAVLLTYYSAGFAAIRLHWPGNSSRFLTVLVALAIPFAFEAFRSSRAVRAYIWALALSTFFHATRTATSGSADYEGLALLEVAFVATVGGGVVALTRSRRALGGAVAVVVFCAAVLGIDVIQRAHRPAAWAESSQLHATPRYWHAAAVGLDQPEPRTIAVTSGAAPRSDQWFAYPLLGRRLQNRLVYVPITRTGRIVRLGPGVRLEPHGDEASWLERVRASGVSDVVSFEPPGVELIWMSRHPDLFRLRQGDARWGWFEVRREAEAR